MKTYRAFIYRAKVITTGEGGWFEVEARSPSHARKLFEEGIKNAAEVKWDPHMKVEISEADRAEIDDMEEVTVEA